MSLSQQNNFYIIFKINVPYLKAVLYNWQIPSVHKGKFTCVASQL